MHSTNRKRIKAIAVSTAALSTALMLGGCPPTPIAPSGFDLTQRLVFPRTTQAVTVDGEAAEAAWGDGFAYELEQGTMDPAATLRGVANDTDFYISLKAEGNATADEFDTAVFLLNPTGNDTDYHRIIISPCGAGGAGCPGGGAVNIVPTIQYQTGQKSGSTVNWNGAVQNSVPGVDIKASNGGGGVNNHFAVEMKIPRSALGGFSDNNWMGLLVNGIVADLNTEEAVVYSWPLDRHIIGEIDAVGGTGVPAVAQWGNATLSTAFGNGVSVVYNEFGSNQANPSEIALNAPNSFHAWAINNSSAGGTPVAADAVSATFQIRNFGLGNDWPNVPVSGNPAGPANIPGASAHLFETGVWALNATQQANYTTYPNQCVRVTLSSSDADTVIATPTVMRNMHFVTINSPFEARAQLSLDGFAKTIDRENPRLLMFENFVNLDPEMRWETRLAGAEQVGETWWQAMLKSGEGQPLGVRVSPDDRLRLESTRTTVPVGTGSANSKPIEIPVESGGILTLIADGTIDLGGFTVSAGGISPAGLRQADRGVDRGKLAEGRPERYGTLLGSFDGFRTHFPIGGGATIRVPEGARLLSLVINDGEEGYRRQKGEGFSVQAIPGKVTPWMRSRFPELQRKTEGAMPMFLPFGANLPAWVIHGQYATRDTITIGGKSFRVNLPAGSFGYWIRDVGTVQSPGVPGRTGITSVTTAAPLAPTAISTRTPVARPTTR